MKPLYEDGDLNPQAAKVVPAAAHALKTTFGKEYVLHLPDDFDWDSDDKRLHDAQRLFITKENPEELLNLFENADAERMGAVVKAITTLRVAIGELSEQAHILLDEHESHRDQSLANPTGVELLSLDVLRNRTKAASEAKRWIENSGRTVRSDKRWDAIAVAFECFEIWERQMGEPPFLDLNLLDESPFGRFLSAIFSALEINAKVRATFKQLRQLKMEKPPITPSHLRKSNKNNT